MADEAVPRSRPLPDLSLSASPGERRAMDLVALTRPSLVRRLVLLAVGWSLAALVITAALMAFLFERAAESRVDQTLNDLYINLVANSSVQDGQVFAPLFTDERALRVYSGRYWEIAEFGPDGKVRPI